MSIIDERLEEIRIVPVVKIERAEHTKGLAGALVRGGIPCAEMTFRTDAAAQSIRLMSEAYPEMLVGAGTVLKTGQVDAAIEAGAEFIGKSRAESEDRTLLPGKRNPSVSGRSDGQRDRAGSGAWPVCGKILSGGSQRWR